LNDDELNQSRRIFVLFKLGRIYFSSLLFATCIAHEQSQKESFNYDTLNEKDVCSHLNSKLLYKIKNHTKLFKVKKFLNDFLIGFFYQFL